MTKINVESATKAYGCVNLLIWIVLILLAGVVVGNFFGLAIGLAASMIVTLFVLIATNLNIRKVIKSTSHQDGQ